jgi:hypothetical protein
MGVPPRSSSAVGGAVAVPCHALHATAHRRLQRAVNGPPQPQRSAVRQWVCHSAMFAVQLSEWGYAAAQQQCRGRVDCSAMPCSAHCSAQGTGQPPRRRRGGGAVSHAVQSTTARNERGCVPWCQLQCSCRAMARSAVPGQRSVARGCTAAPCRSAQGRATGAAG